MATTKIQSSLERIIGAIGAGQIQFHTPELLADFQEVVNVVRGAAEELIEMHIATGINLHSAPRLLALVRTAHPNWDV